MDTLRIYLRSLPSDDEREAFAKDCGTTLGHMRNAVYGLKSLSPEVCAQAELKSAGAARRWDLRPDDWHRIWPELINSPGAPGIPVEEVIK